MVSDLFMQSARFGAWVGSQTHFIASGAWVVRDGFVVLLYSAMVFTAVTALVRMFHSARATRGGSFASFAEKHAALVRRNIPLALGATWLLRTLLMRLGAFVDYGHAWPFEGSDVAVLLLGIATAAAARFGVQALERASTPEEALPAAEGDSADAGTFSAVAVTSTTRAAVGALGVTTVAMVAFVVTTPVSHLGHDPLSVALLVGYPLAALAASAAFRRVSRISVGIDGVLVRGAGKPRFVAYTSFDEVRVTTRDLLLVRRGKVHLRLQLHGADVMRRDQLAARLRAAMERAAAMRRDGAELVVQGARGHDATIARVGAAARGAVDYRQPAVSRERLWDLVLGPSSDADTRISAARALGTSLEGDERARLRVAAAACAEPRVRVELEVIAAAEDDDLEQAARPLAGAAHV